MINELLICGIDMDGVGVDDGFCFVLEFCNVDDWFVFVFGVFIVSLIDFVEMGEV